MPDSCQASALDMKTATTIVQDMAPTWPPADDTAVSSILLDHIPETQRPKVIKTLIRSLRPEKVSSCDFVASLIAVQGDEDAKEELLSFLGRAILSGHVQCAVSISLQYPELGSKLLEKIVNSFCKARSNIQELRPDDATVQFRLSFSNSTASHLPFGETQTKLFHECLDLLSSANHDICLSAKDVIFVLFSAPSPSIVDVVGQPSPSGVWNTIQALLATSRDKLQGLLGYSLWLRWILSINSKDLNNFINNEYWELILLGLRHGDSERRKLCLSILKITTATDSAVVSNDEREQYDRYCTVFETIVLGRYINQIQECKNDLDSLATRSSLQARWLYVLLASALYRTMQESNRKFIGNWVMGSGLMPNDEFVKFFQDNFLPWATQGHLFVSSLRRLNDEMRCVHGDRLASFIDKLLRETSKPHQLVEIIVETILSKRNSMFAYATVYLLEGVKGSLHSDDKEKIAQLSGLPEVALDYIELKSERPTSARPNRLTSRRETSEQKAVEKCRTFNGDVQTFQEIWSDLDYLEYPKRLLMAIPSVLLHFRLIELAASDPILANDLAEKVHTLQRMSETKAFLFPPLVSAIRRAVLEHSSLLEIFDIGEFITRTADHPPQPTIDLMLEEATLHLTPYSYEHYFGERPGYGFAATLDLVSRLHEYPGLISTVLLNLLQPWKDQKCPPPIVSTWKTTLQLQLMLLCAEQYNQPSAEEVHALLEDLFHVLAIEPLPRYRYLLEWIIVRLVMRHECKDMLLRRLATKDHHCNPKHLASLMKIGVILARTQGSGEDFALQLATAFVPLAASSKVVVRHEASWQVPFLMNQARLKSWTSITSNPALAALEDYIRSQERFYEPPLEREAGRFDPAVHHSLANLVEGRWFDLDHIESPLTSRDEFIKLYSTDVGKNAPESCMPLGDKIDKALDEQIDKPVPMNEKITVGPKISDEVLALQTKGAAYLARTSSNPGNLQDRREDIIVVASLVDNPYNLGGLSRVSEIFGASSLCLQNQNVLSNKDFTSVSVSSHLHFPIVQLSASGVPEYLVKRKSEGFTVVGIEQTDRSVILGSESAKLPEKVVLVVGSEKEGIPALLLSECDMLVEIPQRGITRSLNVQTAVSIVLYEYARQHQHPS